MSEKQEAFSSCNPVSHQAEQSSSKIKLIATDLDGTFLNCQHKVSKKNAVAFRTAKDCGYILVTATGRSRKSTLNCIGLETLKQMNYTNLTPGIFLNGMLVYGKNGEILYEYAMNEKQLKALFEFVESSGLLHNLLLYDTSTIWCQELNEYTSIPHTDYGEDNLKEVEGHLYESKCNKAVICAPDEKIKEIKKYLIENFSHFFDFFHALPKFLEIVPKGVNKMVGMTYLLKHLGVQSNEVMAIGDSENDCDLLRGVGFPVAVRNACAKAKNIAKVEVSSNNEDGFAEAVKIHCNIVV